MKLVQMLDEKEVRCILGRFNTKMEDIVFAANIAPVETTFESHVTFQFCGKLKKLKKFDSLSGILLFVLHGASSHCSRVSVEFREGNCIYANTDHVYETFSGGGDGRRLHIFLWTEQSKLFKDYKLHNDIYVFCDYGEGIEWGRIVMVEKGEDVGEVCNEIITEFA